MSNFTRRGLIKTSATVGAGLAMPTFVGKSVSILLSHKKKLKQG